MPLLNFYLEHKVQYVTNQGGRKKWADVSKIVAKQEIQDFL